ncbi:MAG: hypothetical protein AAAB35_01455 [Phyllobacterium sp.]|uniref:hypothetical protein n=1 Tax=Phyllobacterium sp. TaxID=1871046 RepID=UPI0030F0F9F1
MTTRNRLHHTKWRTGIDEAEPESADETVLAIRADGVAVIVTVADDGSYERELSFSEIMTELHERLGRNLAGKYC